MLDFFHNTLNFDHKAQTENPFLVPDQYPAFSFRDKEDVSMENEQLSSVSEADSMEDLIDTELVAQTIDSDVKQKPKDLVKLEIKK